MDTNVKAGTLVLGISLVNRKSSPTVSGWAIITLSALALTLAGCGRKGGLDAPPGALGASGETANATPAAGSEQDIAANKSSSLFNANSAMMDRRPPLKAET